MYGIPNMKLDKKEVVLRRIKLMEDSGIKFICNANVGDNVEAEIFLKEYDATVICTGFSTRICTRLATGICPTISTTVFTRSNLIVR